MSKLKLCPVAAYRGLNKWAGPAVLTLLLLLLRVVFGYGFFQAGLGKLHDISKPIGFFTQLGIPMPVANAWLVACVECFGGLLLLVGLFSRPVSIALTINMTVAFLTADHDAVVKLFSDQDVTGIFNATPFMFMVAALAVLACGPGRISIDALAKRLFFDRAAAQATPGQQG